MHVPISFPTIMYLGMVHCMQLLTDDYHIWLDLKHMDYYMWHHYFHTADHTQMYKTVLDKLERNQKIQCKDLLYWKDNMIDGNLNTIFFMTSTHSSFKES